MASRGFDVQPMQPESYGRCPKGMEAGRGAWSEHLKHPEGLTKSRAREGGAPDFGTLAGEGARNAPSSRAPYLVRRRLTADGARRLRPSLARVRRWGMGPVVHRVVTVRGMW